MYILLAINIIGVAIILYKAIILRKEQNKTDQTSLNIKNLLLDKIPSEKREVSTVIELCKQELSSYITNLESGLSTIKIIASVSPLLGLLGTVIGVLISFKLMHDSGENNPSYFAGGISLALVTTVGGLIVSIPHYVAYSYFIRVIDKLEGHLEKKILSEILI